MQVVVRKYSGKGATELFDMLETRKAELDPLMRSAKGFVSYTLARSDSGGYSITICQDQAGIDESTRLAKEWVVKNASHLTVTPPEVSVGTVLLHSK